VAKYTSKERKLIGVFMTDLCHDRDIQRRMHEMADSIPKSRVLEVIGNLGREDLITGEEEAILKRRIERIYI
jgi:hypothetical protein